MNEETNSAPTATEYVKPKPTHIVWQVIGEDKQAHWIRIGAAWTNRDGKGLSVLFDAYPAKGRTVIRERTEPEAAEEGEGGQ